MVIRSTPVHRPVRSSAEKSTQSILQGPLARSNRAGICVGDVARVVGQQALVGGGHMGVGAEQGRHPAVGIKAQGPLFPGGLRVEVHDAQLGQVRGLQQGVQSLEGAT